MKLRRLFVLACLVALGVSPAMAQDSTVLRIEVIRDGSVVARPELRPLPGRGGRLELNGEWASNPTMRGLRENVVITHTVQGDDITLAFLITSGDKQFKPSLVISKDIRGSVGWTAADGQPLMLTVSWVQ
jgi:hypothetical protein